MAKKKVCTGKAVARTDAASKGKEKSTQHFYTHDENAWILPRYLTCRGKKGAATELWELFKKTFRVDVLRDSFLRHCSWLYLRSKEEADTSASKTTSRKQHIKTLPKDKKEVQVHPSPLASPSSALASLMTPVKGQFTATAKNIRGHQDSGRKEWTIEEVKMTGDCEMPSWVAFLLSLLE